MTSSVDDVKSQAKTMDGSHRSMFVDLTVGYILPLFLLVILGSLNLIYPFSGDAAFFLAGAKAMDQGAVLYLDYWDVKPPGIFLFFLWSGRLFGFTEVSIHLFELCWMLLFAVVLIHMLRRYFTTHWLASIAPIATIGIYYLGAREHHLTQVEILIAFPITLCVWIGSIRYQRKLNQMAAYFVWGLCAALVVAFKLPLLAIPIVSLLISLGHAYWRENQPIVSILLRQVLPVVLGGSLGLAPMLAWLWAEGALMSYLWTTLVWPLEKMISTPSKSFINLYYASKWFIYLYFPWALYIFFAIFVFARQNRDLLTGQFLAWLVVGSLLVSAQKLGWYSYYFLLVVVPAGVLALRGVDNLCVYLTNKTGSTARISFLVLLVLIAPAFSTSVALGAAKATTLAKMFLSGDDDWVREFQSTINPYYRMAIDETRHLLEPDALPGPIYVFGHPLIYTLGDRLPAIAFSGWRWESAPLTESDWNLLPKELKRAQPAYIFVDPGNQVNTLGRSTETVSLLNDLYEVVRTSPNGTWYRIVETRQ